MILPILVFFLSYIKVLPRRTSNKHAGYVAVGTALCKGVCARSSFRSLYLKTIIVSGLEVPRRNRDYISRISEFVSRFPQVWIGVTKATVYNTHPRYRFACSDIHSTIHVDVH